MIQKNTWSTAKKNGNVRLTAKRRCHEKMETNFQM